MNLLFICNQNQNRSKRAEEIFNDKFNTKSAGLYCKKPVSKNQIKWADIIIVMEEEQRDELAKRFPTEYMKKRILNFDIPDVYHHDSSQLANSLQSSMNKYLELLA